MKKIGFICLLFLSGIVVSQTEITKKLDDFSVLKVYNGIKLTLIKSKSQKIKITGEKPENVMVKNVKGTLKIYIKLPKVLDKNSLSAKLYFSKNIEVIDANEGATITGKGIEQDKLEVRSQEGAFVNLNINTGHVKVKGSSGGVLTLSGTTKSQDVKLDLGGIYHGYDLKTIQKSVVKSGSGAKAEVNVGNSLDAKVTFGGSIFYKGNPKKVKSRSIAGGVIEKR